MPVSTAIVTLSGYADILAQFHASVEMYEPDAIQQRRCFAILSNGLRHEHLGWSDWNWYVYSEDLCEFSFPHNANTGIRLSYPHDVLLVNDDVSFLRAGTVADL